MKQKIKDNLETICFAFAIIGAVVAALTFLATKEEVQAVDRKLEINRLNDQLRETQSAIIQVDKQLMWIEQKLSAEGKNCALDSRWRELRNELDNLQNHRENLRQLIKEMKTKK